MLALERFADIASEVRFPLHDLVGGSSYRSYEHYSGVSVSVRPDVVVLTGDADDLAGGVILYLVKSHPLDEVGGYSAAAVFRKALEQKAGCDVKLQPRNVRVIDVFAQNVYLAPRAHKRRLNDVSSACEEIEARWHRV